MADIAFSIFDSLDDMRAADTGSGGLAENTDAEDTAVVRHFIRAGDPNFDERTHNWPVVKVDILHTELRSFSNRHADMLVRMHVFTQRDKGFAGQSAVNARIVTVYDRASPSSQPPFSFSIMSYLRGFIGPTTGNELHYVHEFSLRPMA